MVILLFMLVTMTGRILAPIVTARLIDEGLVSSEQNVVIRLAVGLFIINAVMAVSYVAIEHFRLRGYTALVLDLRKEALDKLLRVKMSYFFEQSPTEIFSQLEQDIKAIAACFSTEIMIAFMQIFVLVGLIPTLWGINWKLTLLTLAMNPLKIIKTLFIAKKRNRNARKLIASNKKYSGWLSDVIHGVKLIRQNNIKNHFTCLFYVRHKEEMGAQYKHEMFETADIQIDEIAVYALEMISYILGGYYISKGELSIGEFVAFQAYSIQLLGLVSQFTGIAMQVSVILPSFERFRNFLDLEEESTGEKSVQLCKNCYDISFEHITFEYDNHVQVFSDFSLGIKSGSKIAVVGVNGSGKSTMIDLLLRYYHPQNGQISLGGIPVEILDISEYRGLFSVAYQMPVFFCDTIKNNICLYRNIPQTRLDEIAEKAGLSALIEEKGWNYCIGENGCELSGGQKQLINLCRVLVRDTPIIILDETEAHVDVKYKSILENLFKTEFFDKTIIMITHHNELLSLADSVIDLEKIGRHVTYENCNS